MNLIQVARNSISKDKKYNKRKEDTQIRNGVQNVQNVAIYILLIT